MKLKNTHISYYKQYKDEFCKVHKFLKPLQDKDLTACAEAEIAIFLK